jgi:Ca2+-binding EF-hand superfamily protein
MNMADPTFDLDGDGFVSNEDLVLAKKFDKDQDGRLNTGERKEAKEAIAQGYKNYFIWGIEEPGVNRGY